MHGLQDIDDLRGRAAVQIVDVQDDAFDFAPALGRRSVLTNPLRKRFEILAHEGNEAQVLAIIGRIMAVGNEAG